MDDFQAIQHFIAMLSGHRPVSLTHLTLSYLPEDTLYHQTVQDKITPIISHEAIPPLQYLFLHGVRVNWTSPACQNLTQLILRQGRRDTIPCIPELVGALSQCPGIRFLHFDDVDVHDSDLSPSPSSSSCVLLSALEQLHIATYRAAWAAAFFRSIIAPNLRTLKLAAWGDWCEDLVRTLIRPYPGYEHSILRSVRALDLSAFSLKRNDVELRLSMYRELDDLVTLVVNCSTDYGDSDFLNTIIDHTNNITSRTSSPTEGSPADLSILFPCLRTLVLSEPKMSQVKDFVEARQKAGVPIQRLFFQIPGEDDEHTISFANAEWLAHNVDLFASFQESTSWGCAVDHTLERLLEADIVAEADGVSFLDVFCRT